MVNEKLIINKHANSIEEGIGLFSGTYEYFEKGSSFFNKGEIVIVNNTNGPGILIKDGNGDARFIPIIITASASAVTGDKAGADVTYQMADQANNGKASFDFNFTIPKGEKGDEGPAPIITLEKDENDGHYYWKSNGKWILDANNNKISSEGINFVMAKNYTECNKIGECFIAKDNDFDNAGKQFTQGKLYYLREISSDPTQSNFNQPIENFTDCGYVIGPTGPQGNTPQFRINEKYYWEISYDNGKTWNLAGKSRGEKGDKGETPFPEKFTEDGIYYWKTKDGFLVGGDNRKILAQSKTWNPTVKANGDISWALENNPVQPGEQNIMGPAPTIENTVLTSSTNQFDGIFNASINKINDPANYQLTINYPKLNQIENVDIKEDTSGSTVSFIMTDKSKNNKIDIKNGTNGNDGNDGNSIIGLTGTSNTGSNAKQTLTINTSKEINGKTEHTFNYYNGTDGNSITGLTGTSNTGSGVKQTLTINTSKEINGEKVHTFNYYNGTDGENGIGVYIKSQRSECTNTGYCFIQSGEDSPWLDGHLYYKNNGKNVDTFGNYTDCGKIKGEDGTTPSVDDFASKNDLNNYMPISGDTSQNTKEFTLSRSQVIFNTEAGKGVVSNNGFYDTSDERLKNFKDEIDIDFNKLKSIPKSYFTWKTDETERMNIGTSAQAVEKIYPELVARRDDGYLAVDYAKLSVVALKAVDVLNEENVKLKERLRIIEEKLGL